MIDRKIGKIKVRRGTDSQRVTNTFEEGEVIYSVDKKRIFVGDDATLGGVPVSNRNYIADGLGIPPIVPSEVMAGDIIYDKSDSKTYIVHSNLNVLELLLIADGSSSNNLKTQISDIYTKIRTLTSCLTPPPPPPPPPSKLNWVVQPSNFSVNVGDTVTFSSSAVGTGNITYEWKRRDALTINTTNVFQKSFTITSAGIPDIATYYCVASNSIDSITSREAVLNIGSNSILAEDGTYVLSELSEFIDWEYTVVAPIITKQPVSVSVNPGTSVTFRVEAMGTDPLNYQWRVGGTNVAGETKNTYTITNPTVDINSISCKVSNIGGEVLSNSVNLTVIVFTIDEPIVNERKIAGGYYHTVIIGSTGGLSACGKNDKGQLGDGTTTDRLTPVSINLPPVRMVAAGRNFTMAVGTDNGLSAWGSNDSGNFGNGSTTGSSLPIKLNVPPIRTVATGDGFTLIVGQDGGLSGCGKNGFGQLGIGNKTDTTTFVKVDLPPVAMVAAGDDYTFALTDEGKLYAWGWNTNNQLGDGTEITRTSPVKINLPPIAMIAAGNDHTMAVGIDGGLSAWGFNGTGQLGIGSNVKQNTPVKVNVPSISMIALGWEHSLLVGTDGGLSACGRNDSGQLGDGTTTHRSTPVKIDLPPIYMVNAGYYHSIFLAKNGSVYTCGDNDNGQLGNNTTFDSTTPILVD